METAKICLIPYENLLYTKFEMSYTDTSTWFTLLFKKGVAQKAVVKWLEGISKATNDLTFIKGMLGHYSTVAETYLYKVSRLQKGNLEASERNEQLRKIELPLIDPEKVTPKSFLEFRKFITNHYYSADEEGKLIDKSNLSGLMWLSGVCDIKFHYNYQTICDLLEGCVTEGVWVRCSIKNSENASIFVEGKCANLGDVKKLLRSHFGGVVVFK